MAPADSRSTVERIASEAPPLSEAQRARLAALLKPAAHR